VGGGGEKKKGCFKGGRVRKKNCGVFLGGVFKKKKGGGGGGQEERMTDW